MENPNAFGTNTEGLYQKWSDQVAKNRNETSEEQAAADKWTLEQANQNRIRVYDDTKDLIAIRSRLQERLKRSEIIAKQTLKLKIMKVCGAVLLVGGIISGTIAGITVASSSNIEELKNTDDITYIEDGQEMNAGPNQEEVSVFNNPSLDERTYNVGGAEMSEEQYNDYLKAKEEAAKESNAELEELSINPNPTQGRSM